MASKRLISMSRDGRFVAIRQARGFDIVDALGTNPRVHLDVDNLEDFVFAGDQLLASTADDIRLFAASGEVVASSSEIAGAGVLQCSSRGALWRGSRDLLIGLQTTALTIKESPSLGPVACLLADESILQEDERGLGFAGQEARSPVIRGLHGLQSATALFGGRVIAIHIDDGSKASIVVIRPLGARVHNIEVATGRSLAVAETRGLAIAYDRDGLLAIDLRYGRRLGDGEVPISVEQVEIDSAGKHVAIAGFREEEDELAVLHLPLTSVFGGGKTRNAPPAEAPTPDSLIARSKADDAGIDAASEEDDGGADETHRQDGSDSTELGPVPDTIPTRLGVRPQLRATSEHSSFQPYSSSSEHLEGLVDLIAARAARAIAEAWNSGRLSSPTLDRLPFEHEVRALVGVQAETAVEAVAAAREVEATIAAEVTGRAQATLAGGLALPFFEVTEEFGLSPIAAQALIVALGPQIRGETARLYGVLANDEGRPICDRYLVEQILASDDRVARAAIARELEPDAPLCRLGLIEILPAARDMYLFAPITVDPALVARLRGHPFASYGSESVAEIRNADRALAELSVVGDVLHRVLVDLASAPADDAQVRLVLRGRPGSGRRAVFAALAARVGRAIAVIDCERLPHGGRALAAGLRIELRRAQLRGAIPCVSHLEVGESIEADRGEHLREVLRSHPGPLFLRTTPEYHPPLDPGFLDYQLAPLSEGQRLEFWRQACSRQHLAVGDPASLASRFRIGPGTIERVVGAVADRVGSGAAVADDYTEELDAAARQHIESRLSSVASRVTRLARWQQVALPDELLDSIREFIGRVRHRRTVYETWGFEEKMATSRGLTALFYGAPGTGKTMVAGLIARELDLDLYRVDLARITSKWVGETEKNLAEVFDAAEDGQAVIVFDEADSLFAKRTEVKSSVDRYANLEVGYLLQRLDTFEGIAILTTNLEGSIDSAFKRRLSLRLAFPFPDEALRVRLWAAHIPPELPIAGDFDFEDLARRFPMSGGYIRNSTLRAAFLAAQEGTPLTQEHLLRAIHLEYQEMGKLSAGGRIE